MSVTRPVLCYHGGKWKLAPWIVGHFPPHRVYVEPYGGAASVLMRKARSHAEIYNDLDGGLVNVFRVLRDPATAAELERVIRLTPFAREEFEAAYLPAECPVERARRTIIRSFMGFGSAATYARHLTGFRSNSTRAGTTPARDWANWPDAIKAMTARLAGVVIEQRDALAVIAHHDGPETLHYVDPPYPHSTRSFKRCATGQVYQFELTDTDHELLALALRGVKGAVVLSGYSCPLYDRLYVGWSVVKRHAYADGARARVECLWLNEQALDGLQRSFDFGLEKEPIRL